VITTTKGNVVREASRSDWAVGIFVTAFALMLAVVYIVLMGNTANATGGGSGTDQYTEDKITICHATGSESNPYVEITVDVNGLNGHGDHPNDIIPAPEGGCPEGGTTTHRLPEHVSPALSRR
jgi:hypothetical protein